MTTLAGGVQIATQGMSVEDNNALTAILNQRNSGATPTILTFSAGSLSGVVATLPPETTVDGIPQASTILLGNVRVSEVSNVNIVSSDTVIGGISVVDTSAVTKSGAVTNLVVDNNISSVVLNGTQNNSVSVLFGGTNTSVVAGDAGSNFVVLSNNTAGATVVSGVGNDSILGGSGGDNFRLGDSGVANGGSGADTLIGGIGSATLGGGAGADSIVAGAGGGYLVGEAGTDTLVGGAGKDVAIFSPGDGNDTFVGFDPTQDTLAFASVRYDGGTLDINALIQNATVTGGNTILTLPDGSTITVVGATGINLNWFTIK